MFPQDDLNSDHDPEPTRPMEDDVLELLREIRDQNEATLALLQKIAPMADAFEGFGKMMDASGGKPGINMLGGMLK